MVLPDEPLSAASLPLTFDVVPMEKVKAPCTGCESAEITRQDTMYVP